MRREIVTGEQLKEQLYQLAYNLWAFWDYEVLNLFREIDGELFCEVKENPVKFLNRLAKDRLDELVTDKKFSSGLEWIFARYREYVKSSSLFSDLLKDEMIAYFSMEYGLHGSIPIYSGGLGILSGDHLKGASDLGIPIVGVGLFYRYGYFAQRITAEGVQEEFYKENRIEDLPLREVVGVDNKPLSVKVKILGTPVKIKVLEANIGRVKLLLLSTDTDENPPEYRDITDYLYVADRDKRIQQEIVLGFGGYRVLRAMGFKPSLYHLNEGHSAFIIVERLKDYLGDANITFEEATRLIRESTVFTTHTPVEAGNENFSLEMIKKYLGDKIKAIGIPFEDFVKLGANRKREPFWLPALAIRFSSKVNGVSKLHAEVSKKMWKNLFFEKGEDKIPILGITNGVHHSWMSEELYKLFVKYLGSGFIFGANASDLSSVFDIPDEKIWRAHQIEKEKLLHFLEIRMGQKLNPEILTIGYARRFATYKRATLLLEDRVRLKEILRNQERPVQVIFAGKAHPADEEGKNLIKVIIEYAREYGLEDRIFFVEDYDMTVAQYLVKGVDVWLNNPLKPMEASGTSGMKAGINGVLNLSVLDGWWPECYNGKNGWAITSGEGIMDSSLRGKAEAKQIYELLENTITKLFYTRDNSGLPGGWISMMKESIYSVYKDFNIGRMLGEYVEKFYLPVINQS